MPNQTDFHKVCEYYLKPLTKIFTKAPNESVIEAFVEDLADFNPGELAYAAKITRRKRRFFPSIYEAMTDCAEARAAILAKSGRASTSAVERKFPWEERREKRAARIKEYVETFKRSSLAEQGRLEGWERELIRYVEQVAFVQAQMLVPGGYGLAYGADVVFLHSPSEAEVRNFLDEQREQCAHGGIDVEVPAGHIATWRERAERERKARQDAHGSEKAVP